MYRTNGYEDVNLNQSSLFFILEILMPKDLLMSSFGPWLRKCPTFLHQYELIDFKI
jgi:hypothetical protein